MKLIQFSVTLELSDKINQEEQADAFSEKIAEALTKDGDLVPKGIDTKIEMIAVKAIRGWYRESEAIRHL